MNITALDPGLDISGIIDDYYSLSWKERYYETGEFELVTPPGRLDLLTVGSYIMIPDSETVMCIEAVKDTLDTDGEKLTVSGRCAKSLLSRRRMWDAFLYFNHTHATYAIHNLLTAHFLNPTKPERKMDILGKNLEASEAPPYTNFFEGPMSIYDVATDICTTVGIGYTFKRGLDPDVIIGERHVLDFEEVIGVDRSFNQTEVPRVIFSPHFNNVVSSSFLLSFKQMINVVGVMTNDVTYPETWVTDFYGVPSVEPESEDRYEDAIVLDIDRDVVDPPLTDYEVLQIIHSNGTQIIRENSFVAMFEANVDIQGTFKYGTDYFMGDIIQCRLHGLDVPARVVELIRSYSQGGSTSQIALDFNP